MDIKLHSNIIRTSTPKQSKTTEVKNDSFKSQMQENSSVNKKDKIVISGGSISNRLDRLNKISKDIDYTGMSDEEIYRSIDDKYDETFPGWQSMFYYDLDNYDKITEQLATERVNAVGNKDEDVEFRKRAYGYENMSNDEIISAILQDVPGSDPISRTTALVKMAKFRAIDPVAASKLTTNMWRNIEKNACAAKGLNWEKDQCFNNPLRKQWALALAKTMSLSFSSMLNDFESNDLLSKDSINENLNKLEDALDKVLEEEKGRKL